MQVNFEIETVTKSGKTYKSFNGINTEDFAQGTSNMQVILFVENICVEEVKQDAHFLL